ncbi:small ubiquitin-related modifier 2-like [Rutidosis leptorrhynchoides]|uniref:small ubiquitin-related modifier 2-like n=1 Tax=Rutidosis leptorrhynchoides TaxID=125765 RepID=UPI003A98FC02
MNTQTESVIPKMNNIKKPEASFIQISVKDQKNKKLFFKMKRNHTVRKVLITYCEKTGVDYRTVVFLFEGTLFDQNKTPNQLKMEDGDEIEAMTHALGG